MPQKKAQASPVYEMPHERQVELLSEALLREYMHRRKFTETLHVFDEEHPRDNDTISSRALMSDLMALGTETQRAMKADGVETIMEMLCALRVRRRMELEELKQRASVEAPPTPEKLKKSSKEKKGTSTKSSLDGSLRDKRLRRRDTARHKKYTGSIATDDSSNNNNNNNNSNSATSSEGEMESERRPAGSPKSELGSRLGKKLTRSIMRLLCGKKSLPASFLEQGFVFVEDVEYGLVQWERGPDGVIAVVQAFICAYFFRGGFVDVQRHQQQCLLRALTTILSSAQPDPRRVRLVNGPVGVNSVEADMVRLSVKYDFFSMPEVEESLHSLLEHWMQPRGSGVLCFLLSVLLSRGVDAAATILDGATTSLIDEEGRCSSNLARLLLRGEEDAAAAASDDVLSGLALGICAAGMACGYVSSGLDATLLDEEGAKNPRHPVWVVHHGGQFVVLFLKKDTRRQFEQRMSVGMPASSDIFFYDPGVAERGERFLTVSPSSSTGAGQKNEKDSSFLHDAVHAIPLWCDGEIDWNGFDPLL